MPAYAENLAEGSRSWLETNRCRLLLDFQVGVEFASTEAEMY